MERVDHDRQLLGRLLADRRLDGARVRPVRDARRVERERRDLHPAAAHEVAGDVVDDLVAVDVRVVVRRRDRERVVVELARHERADDEVPRPANVWWTGGGWWTRPVIGSKSRDVEGERPEVAVPADDVERVVPVVVGGQPVAHLDVDHGSRPRRSAAATSSGSADVALRVRASARAAGRSRCGSASAARSRTGTRGTASAGRCPRPGPAARSSRSGGRGSRPGRSGSARRSCRAGPLPSWTKSISSASPLR